MKKISFLALVGLISLASCQKEVSQKTYPSPAASSIDELVAPDGFSFNATKTLNLDITVNNAGYSQAYTIEVYDNVPQAGGSLLFKGFTQNDEVQTSLMVPSSLKRLYIVQKDPAGASATEVVEVKGKTVNYHFGLKKNIKKTVIVSPDCNTGCDQSISSGSWLDLNASQTYCIHGNLSGGINDNNGNATIRICGNVTLSGNLSLKGNTKLEITEGSTLNVPGINMNDASGIRGFITVYNNANLNITSQNFSAFGTITNYGTITVNHDMYFYGSFTNNGTVHVLSTGYSTTNAPGTLVNNGHLTVDGYFTQNSNNTIENNCYLEVKKDFEMSSVVKNYSYIEVGQNYKSNNNAALTYYNGAMMFVKGNASGYLNGDMNGIGTTSVVKINGGINSNSSAQFTGNLEFCVGGTHALNASTMVAPATFACGGAYIPVSSCNPTGNGTPTVVDIDGDNVPDTDDLFPNDPDRAGEIYYPSSGNFATIAFEDLWPAMGDYDFNDLVMDYRLHWITDGNNDVKDLKIEYKVRAIGAGFKNGFGLEVNVAPTKVASVSRTTALSSMISLNANGTEAGQSKTVLIFFDNANDELPNPGTAFVNTIPGNKYATPKVSEITVTFTNGEDASQFMDFNPFMIVNQDRSKEIHLAGYSPTDLANSSFFGTANDDSNPGAGCYYVNKNNLPWAINVPVSFDYPAEKQDIVKAYHKFAGWVTSNGTANTDWYLDMSGYRDVSRIY